MDTHNILILGGGPAGISTALHLMRLAPELASQILVLEKARYPRHKLCAGALTADAEVVLERLGLHVDEVDHADARFVRMEFAGRGMKSRDNATGGRGQARPFALRMVRRIEFDAWLARNAVERGLEIRQGVTVKTVRPEEDGVLVDTDAGRFRAQIVVGADGSNGVTRRSILPDARVRTARLLEVLTPASDHEPDTAYFDFFPVAESIAGYVWDFPTQVEGRSMRSWGIYDTNLFAQHKRPPLRAPLAAEMNRHGLRLDEFDLQGFPIRWFDPFSQISVPRVLLVGDAAGADPMLGEGISVALGYGRIAAEAIRTAEQTQDYSFRVYKRNLLSSPLGRALVVRWAVTQVLYRLRWAWIQRRVWRRRPLGPVASRLMLNWAARSKRF